MPRWAQIQGPPGLNIKVKAVHIFTPSAVEFFSALKKFRQSEIFGQKNATPHPPWYHAYSSYQGMHAPYCRNTARGFTACFVIQLGYIRGCLSGDALML